MAEKQRGRLDSWKEIADYLARDVRTVIRWEKDKGLPVHRVPGGKRQAVFAYTSEIDKWLSGLGPNEHRIGDSQLEGGYRDRAPADRPWISAIIALAGAVSIVTVLVFRQNSPVPEPRVVGYAQLTNDGHAKGEEAVTDGSRLYFRERVGSRWILAQVDISGGEVVAIPTPFQNAVIFDISPDGSQLLVASWVSEREEEKAVWLVPQQVAHHTAWVTSSRMEQHGRQRDNGSVTLMQATSMCAKPTAPNVARWPRFPTNR